MADGPILAVRGEVFREVPPEIARFSVTVVARDKNQSATLARLSERAKAVSELIDTYGDAIDRRETGDLRMRAEFKGSGERVAAYHGSATTTVTVTDFSALGGLMFRLAEQEQASVSGPWWELRPGSPVHADARRAAIAEAIGRAREYADALGARVTALLDLADSGMTDRPMMTRAAFGMTGPAADGTPLELELNPQPQTVHAVVEARFAISPPSLATAPGQPGAVVDGSGRG